MAGKGPRRRPENSGATQFPAHEIPSPPQTLEDARAWASWATHAVTEGKIDARTAKEISSLLRTFVATAEKLDVAAEIERLGRQVAELKRAGHGLRAS